VRLASTQNSTGVVCQLTLFHLGIARACYHQVLTVLQFDGLPAKGNAEGRAGGKMDGRPWLGRAGQSEDARESCMRLG
jgi:hypothetical protein